MALQTKPLRPFGLLAFSDQRFQIAVENLLFLVRQRFKVAKYLIQLFR